jgi:hypothetical protein
MAKKLKRIYLLVLDYSGDDPELDIFSSRKKARKVAAVQLRTWLLGSTCGVHCTDETRTEVTQLLDDGEIDAAMDVWNSYQGSRGEPEALITIQKRRLDPKPVEFEMPELSPQPTDRSPEIWERIVAQLNCSEAWAKTLADSVLLLVKRLDCDVEYALADVIAADKRRRAQAVPHCRSCGAELTSDGKCSWPDCFYATRPQDVTYNFNQDRGRGQPTEAVAEVEQAQPAKSPDQEMLDAD